MKGNIPIPELPFAEEVWLIVAITSVRERRTQQGKPFRDASARNASGGLALKLWAEVLEGREELKPGLWGVTGKLESFQDRSQFVVTEYKPITIEKYREHQTAEPVLPRAFTMDIETLALPGFRDRVGPTGRVLSIAVHVGQIPGCEIEGLTQAQNEYVFGIDRSGNEQKEAQALRDFLNLMSDFDSECDEIVGHNIIGFDLPFIFQRYLANNIAARPFVNLGEYNVRGVFDTMRGWWLGGRQRVGLDDVAWALGFESSKTSEVEGSKVFDLYQAGKLAEIREYNLNDVRVTRKVYERMIACFGR